MSRRDHPSEKKNEFEISSTSSLSIRAMFVLVSSISALFLLVFIISGSENWMIIETSVSSTRERRENHFTFQTLPFPFFFRGCGDDAFEHSNQIVMNRSFYFPPGLCFSTVIFANTKIFALCRRRESSIIHFSLSWEIATELWKWMLSKLENFQGWYPIKEHCDEAKESSGGKNKHQLHPCNWLKCSMENLSTRTNRF